MPASKSYRLYVRIGRLLSPLAITLLRAHGRATHTRRARVVVCNEDGEILLIRSWIGRNRWELPGGGVERREEPQAAARRELFEETGIDAPQPAFTYITTLQGHYEALIYQITVPKSQLPQKPHNPKEIVALQWWKPVGLSTDTSELVRQALQTMSKTHEI